MGFFSGKVLCPSFILHFLPIQHGLINRPMRRICGPFSARSIFIPLATSLPAFKCRSQSPKLTAEKQPSADRSRLSALV